MLVLEERTVRRDLRFEAAMRDFAAARVELETALRVLEAAPGPESAGRAVERWRGVHDRARALTATLDLPPALRQLARVEAAILARVGVAMDAPPATSIDTALPHAALAELAGTFRDTAYARRDATLQRHRLVSALVFALLAVEILILVFPSSRRLAAAENEAERAGAQLAYLAHHDDLTGLANRRGLEERLEVMAATADAPFGVILCDLDGFKPINDVYGHEAGDTVLKAVAGRLQHDLRPGDLAARLGGDEFVLVVAAAADMQTLTTVAERLQARLAHPVTHGQHRLHFAASLGAALFPVHGGNVHALLAAADAAMYEAKQHGGMAVRAYTTRLRERDELRHAIVADLERALVDNALSLAFQPQIELATGRLFGFEALTRWPSEHRPPCPPEVFIPIAERAGLLAPLTRWVIDECERLFGEWRGAGLDPGLVGINLTGHGLVREDLFADFVRLGTGVGRLGIEISEDAMFGRHAEAVREQLAALYDQGVDIAIDDFGTGYASLSHLDRMPFHRLKVAGSFMEQLAVRPNAATVVRTVIELAQRFGGRCVATRVETAEQLAFLRRHHCDIAQGYHFARPLTPSETRAYLGRAAAGVDQRRHVTDDAT